VRSRRGFREKHFKKINRFVYTSRMCSNDKTPKNTASWGFGMVFKGGVQIPQPELDNKQFCMVGEN